jgi:hypothetical protein
MSIYQILYNSKISPLQGSNDKFTIDYSSDISQIVPIPLLAGITAVYIENPGSGYITGILAQFQIPNDPSGLAASGYVELCPTKESFSIINPGSGYSIDQTFCILNTENIPCNFFQITSVSASGGIEDYEILPSLFKGTYDDAPTIRFTNNLSAEIESYSDKFGIARIIITNPGSGYFTHDSFGNHRSYPPRLYHSIGGISGVMGSGAIFKTTYIPQYILDDLKISTRKIQKYSHLDRTPIEYVNIVPSISSTTAPLYFSIIENDAQVQNLTALFDINPNCPPPFPPPPNPYFRQPRFFPIPDIPLGPPWNPATLKDILANPAGGGLDLTDPKFLDDLADLAGNLKPPAPPAPPPPPPGLTTGGITNPVLAGLVSKYGLAAIGALADALFGDPLSSPIGDGDIQWPIGDPGSDNSNCNYNIYNIGGGSFNSIP